MFTRGSTVKFDMFQIYVSCLLGEVLSNSICFKFTYRVYYGKYCQIRYVSNLRIVFTRGSTVKFDMSSNLRIVFTRGSTVKFDMFQIYVSCLLGEVLSTLGVYPAQ